jgi:carnitine-CoA ligase
VDLTIPYRRIDFGSILRERAQAHRDRPFLTLAESGEAFTYGEFNERVNRVANALTARGVSQGDYVNVMLPNSLEYLTLSYALKKLGVIEVAINAEFRGPALARTLAVSGSQILVTTPELGEHAACAATTDDVIETLVLVGEPGGGSDLPAAQTRLPFESLYDGPGDEPSATVSDLDPVTVIFTSGTTGVSKGCVLPHRALVRAGQLIVNAMRMTENDCAYTAYPLFHARAAYLDVPSALFVGGRLVLAPRFSASRFWEDMRRFDVTMFSIIGTVMQILWKGEPSAADRDHRVRISWGGPLPIDLNDFKERFGVEVLPAEGVYGMSETGMVSTTSLDPTWSGRVVPWLDVRIADDNDDPVPTGEVGEILVRQAEPGTMFREYLSMPEATVEACRNMWFHTGDLGRLDGDGLLTFLGRKREMIRRAGHNISTWEVEEVIGAHEDVVESAALGVPSPLGEEDLKVYVVRRDGSSLDAEALLEYCRERMAAFMIPQHLEFIDAIPKTPTGKAATSRLLELHHESVGSSV